MSTILPSSGRPVSIDGLRLPAVILFDVNETLGTQLDRRHSPRIVR